MDNTNFLKIVYFDEAFVADFMQIIAGGELKKTTEFITEVNSGIEGTAGIEGGVGTEKNALSKIFTFLSGATINAEASVNTNLSRKSDRIAKNILENTLLADFIALLDADQRRPKNKRCGGIKVFPKVIVRPEVNSFSYIMLIAPFLSMIDGELPFKTSDGDAMKIDITKIEEAIEKGRGYYEFVATVDGKDVILRFNRSAFRNSYTMSDLPKMRLTYYAIHVGQIEKSDLQVQKEFEFGTTKASKRVDYGLTVEKKIIDAVAVIANENRYHPVCDFLNALQWDGTERIRFCLHRFLGSDTDDYTYEALKLFLLGAISRAFKPGCKFEVMLCLVGGQGAGKSSFFRLLAVNDDWFSDDLKKLDDENVYRKMQGHWIIEMSEMIATANAKSIEEIKSFLSRQKETYKIPYETHPADRKRQCVFGGSSNTLDFLPLDRTGNRRFVPVMVYPERAEVHILADEQASREYINQLWAEAMEIYRSGNFRLRFSPAMNAYLKAHQKDFMPEDTKAGQILDYLERYSGSIVCSKQLYKEALGHDYDEPKQWELREINDIMNNAVTGWRAFSNPRYFPEPYRRQKGWERIRNDNEPDNSMDGFQEIPTEEMEQLGLPEEWLKQK